MIPGYSRRRPGAKDYDCFIEELVHGLEGLQEAQLSFMVYGSYASGRYQAGRSDIDAVLIVPGDIVTDKHVIDTASVVVEVAQRDRHIPFQVTVSDLTLFQDKRFGPYLADFHSFFSLEGKVLLGEDPRPFLTKERMRNGIFHTMSFNLRKARLGLLLYTYHLAHDYEKLVKNFQNTLDCTSRAATKLLDSLDGKTRPDKREAKAICDVYPAIDPHIFQDIAFLYKDLSRLDQIYREPQRMLSLMQRATSTFESMIQEYKKEN